MATFVIVHGAWSGAHAWRWVRPLLREAGHEVFTPCLTGSGERAHLASPQVDLETHVRDVVGVVEFEDLTDVLLVGHSYGGMVITGAADRLRSRVSQLVYLDAEVPRDGEAALDLVSAEERSSCERAAAERGEGWRVPPPVPDPLPAGLPPDVRWAMSRFVAQPLATFAQPLRLSAPGSSAARTYVPHTEGKDGQEPAVSVERARSDPDWRFVELPAGHAAHVTAPRVLADLLVSLV